MLAPVKIFLVKHKKYVPVAFFAGGFVWDSLTLGRIDSWYSNTILLAYLMTLSISIYVFNLGNDERWAGSRMQRVYECTPLAIQFFLGSLCSAYVIFFFQSVSLSKTLIFFVILLLLLVSNELFKHRISNRYLQFGAYYFVVFTFFIFFLPVVLGIMNTFMFVLSGILSLGLTSCFVRYIIRRSDSARQEISLVRLNSLILGIFFFVNGCYYFNLIPPVPLSLQTGLVAYDVQKKGDAFIVTYDKPFLSAFGSKYESELNLSETDTVFVYTSIFAPADLTKAILHRWKWYNPGLESWNTTDEISYKIVGGRQKGYRGYTYKTNLESGLWRVEVVTNEGLVLGIMDFEITAGHPQNAYELSILTFD